MTADNRIITLAKGPMRLDVWTIGARLNDVAWGAFEGLVNGSASADEAMGPKLNHGSVVGPVANRIAGASFDLEGRRYSFPANEGHSTLLHSGTRSLRDRVWDVSMADEASARLVTEVPDMADGFPGNRTFEAEYSLVQDGFDVVFRAVTDKTTLVNMALHPYWRLDAGGRDGLRLKVNARRYLPVDTDKIPTGEIAGVASTIFDLGTSRTPSDEIDHNFCLDPSDEDTPSATLMSDKIALDIWTDAPGMQVFTGKSIGIALEPQHWPDAPHHPAFPSIRLEPGETYRQTSRYRFREL
ncbi:MAG: galactose mutarotase [Silicimonas sp.]|nr:galactose mutarotase [Silicimonas sp.]